MSASAPTVPLQLDQLHNDHPVFMIGRSGVAHDIDESGWHTRCGMSIKDGHTLTLIQVHVWLGDVFCFTCFTGTVSP
jgi:hypothetical protein